MKFLNKKNSRQFSLMQLLAVVIILLSAMTFSLPRETFDPHMGVDYDIFCRALHFLYCDGFEISYSCDLIFLTIVEDFEDPFIYDSQIYFLPLTIRPPPHGLTTAA